jgi:hypothetical protein
MAKGDKDDEFLVTRPGDLNPFYIDVVAFCQGRLFAVECDGYKGHSSRRGLLKDMHRTTEIKALVMDIECFRFAFWQLVNVSDDLIAEELGLTCHHHHQ